MRNSNPENPSERSARWWAMLGTVLIHAALLLALLFCFLRYPPSGRLMPPPESEEAIEFLPVEDLYASGEFVQTGDVFDNLPLDEAAPSDIDQSQPSQQGPDLSDAGKVAEPKQTVSSERPSPAKVEKKPKGPTKEQLEAEKQRQEAARRQQAKKTIDDKAKNAFGGGKGSGKAGQTDGNSDTGATSGTPGNGVKGRRLLDYSRVPSTKLGEIAVRVKVDASGKVIEASYDPSRSNGAAAADVSLRNHCVQRTRACKFSPDPDAPTATGTITWRFR